MLLQFSLVLVWQRLMHFAALLAGTGWAFGRDPWVIVWKWLYCLPLVTCYSVMVTSRYMPFRHNYPSRHLFTWPGFTEKSKSRSFVLSLELVDQIVCLFLTHTLYSHRISSMHNRSWPCSTHCSWNKRKSTLEWHIPCSWNKTEISYKVLSDWDGAHFAESRFLAHDKGMSCN